MRLTITAACLALLGATSALAGGGFGLASGVAKQHARTARPAVAASTPTVTVPACTDAPLSVSLIDPALPFHIEPLGHLAPSPHTFPTDHTYFQMNKSTSDTSSFSIYAPADITITAVVATTLLNAVPPTTDYGFDFVPCPGLLGRTGHIRTLSPDVLSAIGPITDCTDSGGIRTCTKNVSVPEPAGHVVGTQTGVAGNTIVGMDFGLFDFNKPALAFLSPERRSDYQNHIVCPYDSFQEPLRSNLEARFARYDGAPRTTPPLCGTAMQDLASTAQGNWYLKGTPHALGVTDDNQLALVHDNIFPSTAVFSVGVSVTGSALPSGLYVFNPLPAGFVNRDFPAVSADTNVYCYDSFSQFPGTDVILLQMPTSITLKIERQSLAACGGGPWTLTPAATEFER